MFKYNQESFSFFFQENCFSTGNVPYTSYVMFSDVDIKWSQMQQQLTDHKKNWLIMILLFFVGFFFCFFKKKSIYIHKLKVAK